MVDVPVLLVCEFHRCRRGEVIRALIVAFVDKLWRSQTPESLGTACGVQFLDKVVDVPVVRMTGAWCCQCRNCGAVAVLISCGADSLGPCTQVQGGGPCPQTHEQMIDVPKIVCPLRAARTVLRAPQLAEQLVEVPTIVSYSSLLQRIMEQTVDIPVPGHGGRFAGLQGFHPNRVQQRLSLSRSLTFLFAVEVHKVFSQDRVRQRRLRRSL